MAPFPTLTLYSWEVRIVTTIGTRTVLTMGRSQSRVSQLPVSLLGLVGVRLFIYSMMTLGTSR